MGKLVKSIFISSTVKELKRERLKIKSMIPTIQNPYVHFEPHMCEFDETFNITETNYKYDDSIKICLKKVEECDYYLLLIKEDYNFDSKRGCSVTELEYNRAKELNKPIFVFILKPKNKEIAAKNFIERSKNEKWIYAVKNTSEIIKKLDKILNALDSSKFIGENPPEGKRFSKHTTIEKTWTIKNIGNVAWLNRYMLEIEGTPGLSPENKKIEIQPVYPGGTLLFRVNYNCKSEGDYYSLWKMVDENDKPFFETDYKGLWVNASVR